MKKEKGTNAAAWFYGQPGFHAPTVAATFGGAADRQDDLAAAEPATDQCADCRGSGFRTEYCCSDEQCSQMVTCETCKGTGDAPLAR